ncbi:MAG: ABC transporter ATP-binding protein [Thermodesulfobacteriota bacterium]
MAANILEVKNLTLRFGGLEALHGLSLNFQTQKIVAVIGPNGAGKTTLLNAISGIYAADEGEIVFLGRSISQLQPHQIAQLGINRTFQQVQLFANLSVLENVMVGLHPRTKSGFLGGMFHLPKEREEERWIRKKAAEALEFLGLLTKADWPATSLSMAEQKKVEMARALVNEPKLLMLDEPVAGLNLREMEGMAATLLKLKEKGQTILLVEHNMDLVMSIADWVIVLNHGTKIGEGVPAEVQRNEQVIAAYLGSG